MKKSIYIVGAILLSFLFVIEVDAKVISDNNLLLTGIFNGVYHLGVIEFDFPLGLGLFVVGISILPYYLIVFLPLLFIYIGVKVRNKKLSVVTRDEKILKICTIVMLVPLVLWGVLALMLFGKYY